MSKYYNNLIVKNLIDFGLSEKEARIYISLTKLGSSSVRDISKNCLINRSSVYVILNEMLDKKLVFIKSRGGNVKKYTALPPDKLLLLAEKKVEKNKGLEKVFRNTMNNLKSINKNTKKHPVIRVFEGINGLKNLHFDYLNTQFKDIKVWENPDGFTKLIPDFFEKDYNARVKKNKKMYAINPATNPSFDTKKVYESYGNKLDEFVFIPSDKFKFKIDVAVYGDKVTFSSPLSSENLFGVIIDHKEIAEVIRNSFDLAFEEAKRLSKKESS